MPEPLRYDQTLPDGQPLGWDMPGATWDGSTDPVLAALHLPMPKQYALNITLTEAVLTQYLTKLNEADALLTFLSGMVPGALGKLNTIGPERAGMIQVFLNEMAAHPEFIPSVVDPAHAPAKAAIFNLLKRALDRREDSDRRLTEALQRAAHDLLSDFSDYYGNAQLCAKRKLPDAGTTVANLAPYVKKGGRPAKTAAKTPPGTGK